MMRSDNGRFAFIVGHYRSGSTWLLNMLSLHPDIRGVQETHIFHHVRHTPDLSRCTKTLYTSVPWSGGGIKALPRHWLLTRFGRFLGPVRPHLTLAIHDRPMNRLDLRLRDQRLLHELLTSSSSVGQYCWRFFDFLWQRSQPSACLLEKTPNNVRYVDDIVRLFPAAKLVANYRDGRDVVVSNCSFRQYYKHAAPRTFRDSVLGWRDAMEAQFRASRHVDLYTLSYEDLLRHPEQTLRKALDHFEVSASSDLLADMIKRSSFKFRSGRERGNEDRHSFLRKGATGDWRQIFGDREIRIFKEIAGDALIRLGYESSYDW